MNSGHIFKSRSSFTLMELLIVIGILAILATVVVLVLNPAEMLKSARDSKRVGDIQTIDGALKILGVQDPTISLGDSTKVYISIPDTSTTCTNLGLPTLPTGYSYNCVATSTLTKSDGTGWIPVNFQSNTNIGLLTLPTDPENSTSTGLYYSYIPGGSYHLRATMESIKYLSKSNSDGGQSDNGYERGTDLALLPSTFPQNWIRVPGNSDFETSDFWVMKYEAKYSKAGNGRGDDAGACYHTSPYDTWDWGKAGTDCPSSWTGLNVVSSPFGSPITGISHDEAKAACTAMGAHLLTNEEYMTIARNAEQVKENWSSGIVGTGCLFRGNVGSTDACGYSGAFPEKGQNRNQKAKFVLSNGQEIYDLSGNVYEHVMRTMSDLQTTITTPTCSTGTGWQWCNYDTTSPYVTSYNDTLKSYVGPSKDSYGATQGMGRVHTNSGAAGGTVFVRGGAWVTSSYAGAFLLYLDWTSGNTMYTAGFRCAR